MSVTPNDVPQSQAWPADETPTVTVVNSAATNSAATNTAATPPATDDVDTVARVQRTLDQIDAIESLTDDGAAQETFLDFLPSGFVLSVVIPVYNERDTVELIIERLRALPLPLEIIVVDDNSTDGTVEVLRQLEELPNVQVIFKPFNCGKGAALQTGFEHCSGDVVIVQDADLEYDPRDIPELIRPIVESECDVVYGSRFVRDTAVGSSQLHQWGNWLLTWASNMTTGLQLTDMETCYKAFSRDWLGDLDLQQNRFGFEPEFTAKMARRGARFRELPISYHARDWEAGKKIGMRDAVSAFYCIVRYAWFD